MTNLYHALTLLCFCAHMIVCPVGYWAIYRSASMIPHSCSVTLSLSRFRNQQDSSVPGLSVTSRRQRRHRNLVTTKFNLINWALETAR